MKYSALIPLLILLAACATPPPPSGSNGDPSNAAWLAQGTADAAGRVLRDADIATAAAMATAAEMNSDSTRQAQTVATMTAVPMQTMAAEQVQRASDLVNDENQIHLNAIATRQTDNTLSMRAANRLAEDEAAADATRRDYFLNAAGIVFFLFIVSGWGAMLKIQLHTKRTHFNSRGELEVLNGKPVYEEEEPAPPPAPVKRAVPFRPRSGDAQTVEMGGEPFPLTRPNGRAIIHTFTHNNLHSMRLNIEHGDFGFRRKSSAAGAGMNELIGLSDGDKYQAILDAMKENGWVRTSGTGNKWTQYGAREVLGLEGLPQQNSAP